MTKAAKDLAVGYQFPSRKKLMTQERMTKYIDYLFSTWQDKLVSSGSNIHTDDVFAKSQGLPGTVADGMIPTVWFSTYLTELFGEGYVKGGKLMNKYIKPMLANDTITMHIRIKERLAEGAAVRYNMDVWCDNQQGETVVVGSASAAVS
ncbi:MAG: hypothetical protein HYU86_10610 [Chloroflexi bacterium]|nr:hypothetical protein [Chloroflexota bacterium]